MVDLFKFASEVQTKPDCVIIRIVLNRKYNEGAAAKYRLAKDALVVTGWRRHRAGNLHNC